MISTVSPSDFFFKARSNRSNFLMTKLSGMVDWLWGHPMIKDKEDRKDFVQFLQGLKNNSPTVVYLYILGSVKPYVQQGQVDEFIREWVQPYNVNLSEFPPQDLQKVRNYFTALSEIVS